MAFTPSATVMAKTKRKTRKQSAPLHGAKAHEELNPAEVDASHKELAAFDPHVFLTRLAAGKTVRDYTATSPSSRKGTLRMQCSTFRAAG